KYCKNPIDEHCKPRIIAASRPTMLMKALSLLSLAFLASVSSLLAADNPIIATGWNRDVVVESTAATPYSSAAASFDVPNNYGFYQAGLPGATRGLPASGTFSSLVDGTVFRFQPYTANNVLQLSASTSSTGTLMLGTASRYSSLSILAAPANTGASPGTLVLHFAGSTV